MTKTKGLYFMRISGILIALITLAGCNSIYLKPNTLDKSQPIYATRGGFSMRHSIKRRLEDRGYTVLVGKATASGEFFEGDTLSVDINYDELPGDTRYFVKVTERKESFQPFWCIFNGFWWWRFNVSIADQTTKQEILSWRGRGCANSSLRKLDKILDELEIHTPGI